MSLDAYPRVSDWLTVADGRFVLKSGKVDIGQRISTALCRIVAAELALDPDEIGVAPVRTGTSPDEGITSGSNSVEQSGRALRLASATLREAAMAKATAMFESDALELRDGIIAVRNSNRSIALADIAVDLDPDLAVDTGASFRDADPPPQRPPRGMRGMADGSYTYLHDIERPNMLHARVIRPPHRKARLRALTVRTVEALEQEGFFVIRDGSFLAVAGETEFATLRASLRLAGACEWEANGGLDEGDIFEMLTERPRISLRVEEGRPVEGNLPEPIESPTLAQRYERPYQLHGSLAPSAALAEWADGKLTVLTHSQGIYPLRESMAEALGLTTEKIEIEHAPGSGCYGHNGADDAAFEAALIGLAIPDRPVLLKWTREDEHAWEPAAPAMTVEVAARLEGDSVTAWSQQAYSDTHRGRPRPGPDRAGPSRFAAAQLRANPETPFVAEPNMGRHAGLHRNIDPVYAFPDRRLTKHLVRDLPLRTSAMRCLGGAANLFAIESMMDELAEEAGADPLAFRRAHLDDPRALEVLDALAAHDRMHRPKPEGSGRGIAYGRYKNAMTRVAVMVELGMDENGKAEIQHAVIAADAGRVIDPDGLTAQLEGGFIQAASWCLHEEVRFDRDGILTRSWESYDVIRFDGIPEIETVLLSRDDQPPLGAGEAVCGPAMAAIGNALYDASGLRLRRLPFSEENIRKAALRA